MEILQISINPIFLLLIKLALLSVSFVLFLAVYLHRKETKKTEVRLMLKLPFAIKGLLTLNVLSCFILFFTGIILLIF